MSDLEATAPKATPAPRVPPHYFAGYLYTEDTVAGGTGDTIDDAIQDYLDHHADEECDWAELTTGDTIEIEVWSVMPIHMAIAIGFIDDALDSAWEWVLYKPVETRTYKVCAMSLPKFHFTRQA